MAETEDLPVRPNEKVFFSKAKIEVLQGLSLGESTKADFTKEKDTEHNVQLEIKGKTDLYIEVCSETSAVRRIRLQSSKNDLPVHVRRSSRQSSTKSARELLGLTPKRQTHKIPKVFTVEALAVEIVEKKTSTRSRRSSPRAVQSEGGEAKWTSQSSCPSTAMAVMSEEEGTKYTPRPSSTRTTTSPISEVGRAKNIPKLGSKRKGSTKTVLKFDEKVQENPAKKRRQNVDEATPSDDIQNESETSNLTENINSKESKSNTDKKETLNDKEKTVENEYFKPNVKKDSKLANTLTKVSPEKSETTTNKRLSDVQNDSSKETENIDLDDNVQTTESNSDVITVKSAKEMLICDRSVVLTSTSLKDQLSNKAPSSETKNSTADHCEEGATIAQQDPQVEVQPTEHTMAQSGTTIHEGTVAQEGSNVKEDTVIQEGTTIQEDTMIQEGTTIQEDAVIQEDTMIQGTTIQEDTMIQEGTTIQEDAVIQEDTMIQGTTIQEDTMIQEETTIQKDAVIQDGAIIHDERTIQQGTMVQKDMTVVEEGTMIQDGTDIQEYTLINEGTLKQEGDILGPSIIQSDTTATIGTTLQIISEVEQSGDESVVYTAFEPEEPQDQAVTVKVENQEPYPKEVGENIVVEYVGDNTCLTQYTVKNEPMQYTVVDESNQSLPYTVVGEPMVQYTDSQEPVPQHITVIQGQDSQFYQQDGTLITSDSNTEVWEALNKLAESGNQDIGRQFAVQDINFQNEEGSYVAEVVENEEVLQNLVDVVSNSNVDETNNEKLVGPGEDQCDDNLKENKKDVKPIPILQSTQGYRKPVTNTDLLQAELTPKGTHRPQEQLLIMPEFSELLENLQPDDDIKTHVTIRDKGQPNYDYRRSNYMSCKYCGQHIKSKHHFRRHIITHPDVVFKPWKCPLCDYRALIKPTIKKHINIHSAVKAYACDQCGKGFNFKQKLQLHMKYHHDIRDFYCPYCAMAFHEIKTLKNHLAHVHHVQKPAEFLRTNPDYRMPKDMHILAGSMAEKQLVNKRGRKFRRSSVFNRPSNLGPQNIRIQGQDENNIEIEIQESGLNNDVANIDVNQLNQEVVHEIEIHPADNEIKEQQLGTNMLSEKELTSSQEVETESDNEMALCSEEDIGFSSNQNSNNKTNPIVKQNSDNNQVSDLTSNIKTEQVKESFEIVMEKKSKETALKTTVTPKTVTVSGVVVPKPKIITLPPGTNIHNLKTSGKFFPVASPNRLPTVKGLTVKNLIPKGTLVRRKLVTNSPNVGKVSQQGQQSAGKKPPIVYIQLPSNVKLVNNPLTVVKKNDSQAASESKLTVKSLLGLETLNEVTEIKTEKTDSTDGTETDKMKDHKDEKVCHVVIQTDQVTNENAEEANDFDDNNDDDEYEPVASSNQNEKKLSDSVETTEPKQQMPVTYRPSTAPPSVFRRSKIYGTHKINANTRKFKVLEQGNKQLQNSTNTQLKNAPSQVDKVNCIRGKKIYSIEQVDEGVRAYLVFDVDPVYKFQRKFCCRLCEESGEKSFSVGIYSRFLEHLSTAHPTVRPFKCVDCGFLCRSKANLISHRKQHGGIKKYVCNTCGKGFLFSQKLKVHMRTHDNRREHICSLCSHAFNEKCDLNRHFRKVHMKERNIQCTMCEKSFFGMADLKRHMETHNEDKSYLCNYCKKKYQTKVSLAQHMKSHTCMFHCEICSRDFGSYSGFMAHKVMHDESQDGYVCNVCSKTLTTKGSLKRHMTNCHTDDRPFSCFVCDKAFKSKKDLQGHSVAHADDRVFVCEVCQFSSKRMDSLKVHMRRHALVKPFQCGVCMKEYTQKSSLEQHLVQHTGQGYMCEVCKKQFATKSLLHQHMMKKHVPDDLRDQVKESGNITVYMCEECQSVFVSQDDLAGHILSEHMKQGLGNAYVNPDKSGYRPEELAIGLGVANPDPSDIECEVVTDNTTETNAMATETHMMTSNTDPVSVTIQPTPLS